MIISHGTKAAFRRAWDANDGSLWLDPKLLDERPPFPGIGFPKGIQRFGSAERVSPCNLLLVIDGNVVDLPSVRVGAGGCKGERLAILG